MNRSDKLNLIRNKKIAIVIDGFINGLGVARSLHEDASIVIIGVCLRGAAITYSNTIDVSFYYNNEDELFCVLKEINAVIEQGIPYYGCDRNLTLLMKWKKTLDNISIYDLDLNVLEKEEQINICEKVGIPYPKSVFIETINEVESLRLSGGTYIIKPANSLKKNPFKTKITSEIEIVKKYCVLCIEHGTSAIVSDFIFGGDQNLLTFGGYSHKGELLMPFTGRKIAQRPKNNGVASLAESFEDINIVEIGSKFLKEVTYTGLFQIEFKIDSLGNYYFIEFNPRNWAWGYAATVSGKNLPLLKFYTETNSESNVGRKSRVVIPSYYMWAEGIAYNLIFDRWLGVLPRFLRLFFSKKKIAFAIFSFKDIKPFIGYLKNLSLFAVKFRSTQR